MLANSDEISLDIDIGAEDDTTEGSEKPGARRRHLYAIFLACGINVKELARADRRPALAHPLHWAVRQWNTPLLQVR